MRIRSRLLLIYGIMIASLLFVGVYSIRAVLEWSGAAKDLSVIHDQSLRSGYLQVNMYRQINYALDYLHGDNRADAEFWKMQKRAETLLEELKSSAQDTVEQDHIVGLEETQYELVWVTERIFEASTNRTDNNNMSENRDRLREIGDETADDVAALNYFYKSEEDKKLSQATKAGGFATLVIGISALVAVLQFIILVVFLQKWLVRPIVVFNEAAGTISGGNLDTRIDMAGDNEWADLAGAINRMALSLKIFQEKLAASERLAAVGEIAAYAAHNIRNPLAGIRAAAQVMQSDKSMSSDELSESLTDIIGTIDRLDAWLKKLLEFARPLEIEPAEIRINQLVSEAVTLAGKSFGNKPVELSLGLGENLPLFTGDPVLIEQALVAITANAFEAIEFEGSITVKTEFSGDSKRQGSIQIIIADDGAGVSENLKPKLFRAFMTSKKGGTGLGLAQAKKIVDLHGGRIDLESYQDKGTTVTINLPVRPTIRTGLETG